MFYQSTVLLQTHPAHQPPASQMMVDLQGAGLFVVTGLVGLVAYLAKRTLNEFDEKIKTLAAKVETLGESDSLISNEIREVKLEMTQNYVTKGDFLHAITVYDAKMDSVLESLKTIAISLQVEKELRDRGHVKQ